METINDFKTKAIKEYHCANQQLRDSLINIFGPKTFQRITDRVFSFEDACQETGRDPNDKFFYACRPHENANRKIEEVAKALNEGVELSFANRTQEKWFVYVVWDDSIAGFRLYGVVYVSTITYAGLGSRHAFANRGLAEHFAKYFMPLINESQS